MKPKQSRKSKRHNKAATQAMILQATAEFLERNGPPVRVARIAEAAQVSTALVNRYFGTADRLLNTYRQSRNNLHITQGPGLPELASKQGTVKEALGQLILQLLNELDSGVVEIRSLRLKFLLGHTTLFEQRIQAALLACLRKRTTGRQADLNALVAFLSGAVHFLLITADQPHSPLGINVRQARDRNRICRIVDQIAQSQN